MFPSDLPPKKPINYSELLVDKPDNSFYLDMMKRVRAAYREAEIKLGGPVDMEIQWDGARLDDDDPRPDRPLTLRLQFTRKS